MDAITQPTTPKTRKPISAKEARRYGLLQLAEQIKSGNRPAPVVGTDVRDIFPDPSILRQFMLFTPRAVQG